MVHKRLQIRRTLEGAKEVDLLTIVGNAKDKTLKSEARKMLVKKYNWKI